MRIIFRLAFCLFFLGAGILAAQTGNYSRVKVSGSANALYEASQTGAPMDHLISASRGGFVGEFSAAEIQGFRDLGLKIDYLIPDLETHFAQQNDGITADKAAGTATTPVGFSLGSMGGYLTFAELVQELDSMYLLYPNLITQKASLGKSIENRDIWMVKVSDNPTVDENEPELLYNALHHSREPMSMMQMIYYLYYLLENYGVDADVTYIVDNREMFFVPCVNPDGYVYNQTTNPNGGGLWRKNRRNNGTDFGVDLNRNYGYEWAYDNMGSSPNSSSNTYRGASAFSEPETQAMRDFCQNRNFLLAFNYHSYGDLLIYPWGYIAAYETPDSALFRDYGKLLTQENSYVAGTGDQTVGYVVNGDSDDWMYGEQTTKNKIFSMTPEVGDGQDGFWPPLQNIIPYCEANLGANMNLALLAGEYITTDPNIPEEVLGTQIYLPVDVKNIGQDTSGPVSVVFTTSDPNILSVNNSLSYTSIPATQTVPDSFSLTLVSGITHGTLMTGEITTTFAGGFTEVDSIEFFYGIPITLFSDSAEVFPLSAWNGNWNVTTEKAHSGMRSITDSPWINYPNNDYKPFTLANQVDLTGYVGASLRFWASWEIEADFDYVQVLISEDGQNWTPLAGKYTVAGSQFSQPTGEPLYDGIQKNWVRERINLSAWDGKKIYLRFQIISDNYVNGQGFFFDDLRVGAYDFTAGRTGLYGSLNAALYPNPARNAVSIEAPGAVGELEWRVTNAQGQLLKRVKTRHGGKVSITDLPQGVYAWELKDEEGGSAHGKLVRLR